MGQTTWDPQQISCKGGETDSVGVLLIKRDFKNVCHSFMNGSYLNPDSYKKNCEKK